MTGDGDGIGFGFGFGSAISGPSCAVRLGGICGLGRGAVVCSDFFYGMLCYVTGYVSGAYGGIRREMKCACGLSLWNVGGGGGGENGWGHRQAHTIGPVYRRALGARSAGWLEVVW